MRNAILAGLFLLTFTGCSGSNASNQCMEDAYKDYLVTKDEHRLDPAGQRFPIKVSAQEEYGRAARECQIRLGDPSDADRAIKLAETVRDDEEW